MKLSELHHHLTPGVLESVKQSYRQGFDWKECLRRQCLDKDAALLDAIADCLEADFFPKLPNIIRYDGHGQPVPPKGGQWIDDLSKGRR